MPFYCFACPARASLGGATHALPSPWPVLSGGLLCSGLFQFVLATDELSDGMFHETVRRIWSDAGPQGLRSYLRRELSLLEDYRTHNHCKLIS